MKNFILFCFLLFTGLSGLSCSESLQRSYDRRHGTSTERSNYDRTDRNQNTTYRRDYSKAPDDNRNSSDYNSGSAASSGLENSQRMMAQYDDMDKVGDLVLYEVGIVENRWNNLLSDYRTADATDRDRISDELDKLSAKQLTLYKAYTRIYKEGKTNWPVVKRDVESTLNSIRE